MHIETLKVFCDLVETQSFSLAAERNFVTQSAVSQQVKTLEEKFNRRLLERVRGRREVRLTAPGEVFYRECKNVLASYDQLQEGMAVQKARPPRISIPNTEDVVARIPQHIYPVKKPIRIKWSLCVLGHQPTLGAAWLRPRASQWISLMNAYILCS